MIEENIKNTEQVEIGHVVDRDLSSNSTLTISAINVNPCQIDLSFISNKYDECDGVYLMWQNQIGGWSQHLFFKAYEREVKPKDLGDAQRCYSNRATTQEAFAQIGLEAYEEWDLVNKIPYDNESHRKDIESLKVSRQVYLYTGEQHSGENKWLLVKVKPESSKTKEKALVYNEFEVTIQFPKLNTITL